MYHSIQTASDEVEDHIEAHVAYNEIRIKEAGGREWDTDSKLDIHRETLERISIQLDNGQYLNACIQLAILYLSIMQGQFSLDEVSGFLNEAAEVENRKNHDYAKSGGHKFFNFDMVANLVRRRTPFPIQTGHNFQFYLALKEARLYTTYWNLKYGMPVLNESISDSALDLYNYIKLLLKWALWQNLDPRAFHEFEDPNQEDHNFTWFGL